MTAPLRRPAFDVPALALLLLVQACTLNQPAPVKHAYLLEASRAQSAGKPPHDEALFVATFRVAEPFAGKGMVYRFDEYRYEADFYNEFFVPPRDIVTQRVLEWLQSAAVFDSVRLSAGGARRGALQLEGLVTEMYGDLRDPQQPRAVLAVQFYVTRTDRTGTEVLFAQQLSQSVPMPNASAEALAAGLSQALKAILTELEAQLRAAPLAKVADDPEGLPPKPP
jgi:cholesterol transport system auxiliary component